MSWLKICNLNLKNWENVNIFGGYLWCLPCSSVKRMAMLLEIQRLTKGSRIPATTKCACMKRVPLRSPSSYFLSHGPSAFFLAPYKSIIPFVSKKSIKLEHKKNGNGFQGKCKCFTLIFLLLFHSCGSFFYAYNASHIYNVELLEISANPTTRRKPIVCNINRSQICTNYC